jgi:hypothetical protein
MTSQLSNMVKIWHQPINKPILGTVEQVEQCLTSVNIEYALSESHLPNHTAFSVKTHDTQKALHQIETNFGRNAG